jgi:hypothetical protein
MQELSRHLAIAFKESHQKHSNICLLEISPLVLHSVYRAGAFLVGLNKDAPSAEGEKGLRDIKETLEMKDGKWKISGKIKCLWFLWWKWANGLGGRSLFEDFGGERDYEYLLTGQENL